MLVHSFSFTFEFFNFGSGWLSFFYVFFSNYQQQQQKPINWRPKKIESFQKKNTNTQQENTVKKWIYISLIFIHSLLVSIIFKCRCLYWIIKMMMHKTKEWMRPTKKIQNSVTSIFHSNKQNKKKKPTLSLVCLCVCVSISGEIIWPGFFSFHFFPFYYRTLKLKLKFFLHLLIIIIIFIV